MRVRILPGVLLLFALALRAADSDPALASLAYSGDQHVLDSLDRELIAAGTDGTKLAAIEKQLLALLKRSDATFAARQAAAQRLGRLLVVSESRADANALKPLAAMLGEENNSDLARLALEPAPGEVIDRILVNALEKSSGRIRLGVIDSIGRRRMSAAVPALTKLLQNQDEPTRAAAASALGAIADPAAVAALHTTPEPSPPAIAAAKLVAASRVPTAAALGLLNELQRKARDPVHRAAAFRQSLELEVGAGAARIADVLGGRDWRMKQVALESLTASRAPNLATTLASKLNTWDAPTQRAVISALGRRGDPAATPAIVAALKHKDADVRSAAVEALGFLPGTRDTATLLAKIAADPDANDTKLARQSLARVRGADVAAAILSGAERGETSTRAVYLEQLALRNMTEAIPLLLNTRRDPEASIRAAAVGALGDIAPPTEQSSLLDWTTSATDSTEQARALRALVNVTLRNPDLAGRGKAIYAAIDGGSPDLAVRLLPALSRIGGAASADAAARLANRDDADVSEPAITTLSRWSDDTALPALAIVTESAARPAARLAALEGALGYFERNRGPWTPENGTVVSRLISSTDDSQTRRKLIKVLHRANDKTAVSLAENLKSDAAVAAEASAATDVIRANLAGSPKIRASNPSGVANILDGKTSTRWTTPALGEEWVEVDFKLSRPIEHIVMDQTGRAAEFPERYEVFVTEDPSQLGNAIASGTGQRTKTVIDLPPQTRGRYLVIKNTAERKDTPWAICELYVD